MDQPGQGANRRGARRLTLFTLLLLASLLVMLAAPTASLAAAAVPAAVWADPDSGYWIELIIVAIVTAVAGIVFNVRRKPDP